MAIKHVGLTPDRGASMDATFVRNSDRKFLVYSDVYDDENFVLFNLGIGIGNAQPFDAQQRCIGLAVRSTGRAACPTDQSDATRWEATVTYGPWNPLTLSYDGNPVNIPMRFRFDFENTSIPCIVDVDGKPIVNSAGDYYDPPVEMDHAKVTLTVSRNESGPNPAVILALENVLNVAVWNGFPAKTVRFLCPTMPEVEYSQATSSFYWPMQYKFDIDFNTWVKQVLNRGYRQLDSNGKLVPIYVNGQPLSDPVFLDSEGKAILTPDYLGSGGDTPDDTNPAGYDGEVAGGGEPPMGGESEEGMIIEPNAYDVYRTYDYTQFNMNTLFTLPPILL
jgi:hypothetical protein